MATNSSDSFSFFFVRREWRALNDMHALNTTDARKTNTAKELRPKRQVNKFRSNRIVCEFRNDQRGKSNDTPRLVNFFVCLNHRFCVCA